MAKVTRIPGQKFLTTEQYRRINAFMMRDIGDSIRDELGVCTPRDVLDHVEANKGQIRQSYIELGLSGVELDRTYLGLQGQAKAAVRQDGGLHRKVQNAYTSGGGRRVTLTR